MTDKPLTTGVSVVIPVYNSQATLRTLYDRLQSVLLRERETFEVIFVDDGSADDSWSAIVDLVAEHREVSGIRMMRNYGQHNALLCGIRRARYSRIATIDDDLQNPPEELPPMFRKLDEGYDVVYGVPEKQRHGLFRDLASQITKLALQGAMGAETARSVSAFRVFRAELQQAFRMYNGPYVSIDVLLTWATSQFGCVRVRHDPRAVGASNYSIGKLISHAMNMMTGFSTLPLQMASVVGFLCTCFGMAVLTLVLVRYFTTPEVAPGFPFLASVIAIFSGAQLFAVGILGEYIARIHVRIMDRPTYTVRTQMGAITESQEGATDGPV